MTGNNDIQGRQISNLRSAIDAIDDRLLALINDRLELAAQIEIGRASCRERV